MAAFPEARPFVQATLDAVSRAGMAPVDMRYFAAREGKPANYCCQRVRSCEIYVAVIGFRYGSIVPGDAISYTELEFEEAGAAGIPRLIFLLDTNASLPDQLMDSDRRAVEQFRRRLLHTGLVIRSFTSASGLELEVFHALSEVSAGGLVSVPRQLPADATYFVGREAELNVLAAAARKGSGTSRTVIISAIDGTAGVGKTALAVHAAHMLASQFPHGQLFLRLHGHTPGRRPVKPHAALAALLLADGVAPRQIPAETERREAMWLSRMADRRVLLVLDDAISSEQVRPLMPSTDGTLVLVTSRHRLTALPEADSVSLDVLAAREATELIVNLADRPDLTQEDYAVSEIARLCGYLPLAIRLLAGQLKHHRHWTAASLATELGTAADRLASMAAEDTSVAASFDMSYRNLSPTQQRLFCRLGLHPGTEIDAYAAAALDEIDLASARRCLDKLFTYHLIDEPAKERYRFHDLIREYARGLTVGSVPAEQEAAMARLLGYYLDATRAADRRVARDNSAVESVDPPGQPCLPNLANRRAAWEWLEAERQNLRACLDHAMAQSQYRYIVELSAAMAFFLRSAGYWDQARVTHQNAATAAQIIGDPVGEAVSLNNLADMQFVAGDYSAAAKAATAVLGLGGDDLRGRATALHILSGVQYRQAEYQSAEASLAGAVSLFENIGDRLGQANALNRLGGVQYRVGKYAEATKSIVGALRIFESIGDHLGTANALQRYGYVKYLLGNDKAAEADLHTALNLYLQLGEKLGQADTLSNLSIVQCKIREYASAREGLTQAIAIYRQIGDRRGEAEALNNKGLLLRSLSENGALRCHREALIIAQNLHSLADEARAFDGIGRCYAQDGNIEQASAYLNRALTIFQHIGAPQADEVEEALATLEDRN